MQQNQSLMSMWTLKMKVWSRNWSQSAKILCSYHQGRWGGRPTPKHVALAMTVRHWTGSTKVIDLLNGLGHSVSTSYELQHDTALANKQLERKTLTPEGFDKKTNLPLLYLTTMISSKKLSGTFTTHCTSGIAIQRQTNCYACIPEADVGECLPPKTEKTREAKSRQTRVTTLEYSPPVYVPPERKGPAAPVHPVDTSTEQWQDIKASCITLV